MERLARNSWPLAMAMLCACSPQAHSHTGVILVNFYQGAPITAQRATIRLAAHSTADAWSGFSFVARHNPKIVVRADGVGSESRWFLNGKPVNAPAACQANPLPQLALSGSGKYLACIGIASPGAPAMLISEISKSQTFHRVALFMHVVNDSSTVVAFSDDRTVAFLVPAGAECGLSGSLLEPARVREYDIILKQFKAGPCADAVTPYASDQFALIRFGNNSESYSTDWGKTWRTGNVLAFASTIPIEASRTGTVSAGTANLPDTIIETGSDKIRLPGQAISATWGCNC